MLSLDGDDHGEIAALATERHGYQVTRAGPGERLVRSRAPRATPLLLPRSSVGVRLDVSALTKSRLDRRRSATSSCHEWSLTVVVAAAGSCPRCLNTSRLSSSRQLDRVRVVGLVSSLSALFANIEMFLSSSTGKITGPDSLKSAPLFP